MVHATDLSREGDIHYFDNIVVYLSELERELKKTYL